MKLSELRFPSRLEADGLSGRIRAALLDRTAGLRPGATLEVPVITVGDALVRELQAAMTRRRMVFGLEMISKKLDNEARGILAASDPNRPPHGERISRLLLCADDGSDRFYRQVERLLQSHAPRLLCCLIQMDSLGLGTIMTGTTRPVKAVMAEHKDAVSDILLAAAGLQERRIPVGRAREQKPRR